jgi:hypothetical protein
MTLEIDQRFQSLDNAQALHLADYPGVYFLCQGATVVYVGKARNIAHRVARKQNLNYWPKIASAISKRYDSLFMAKAKVAFEPKERPYKTNSDLWELLNKVIFECARTRSGRANEKDLKTTFTRFGSFVSIGTPTIYRLSCE